MDAVFKNIPLKLLGMEASCEGKLCAWWSGSLSSLLLDGSGSGCSPHDGQERAERGTLFLRKQQINRRICLRSLTMALQESSWATLIPAGVSGTPLPTVCAQPVCKLCDGFLGSHNN